MVNIELLCPECGKNIGIIEETEFVKFLENIKCPECNKVNLSKDFLPQNAERILEQRRIEQEENQKRLEAEKKRQEEELRRIEQAEQQIQKEEEEKSLEVLRGEEKIDISASTNEDTTVSNVTNVSDTQNKEVVPSNSKETTIRRDRRMAQIRINDNPTLVDLVIGRNIIGRKDNTRRLATILIDTKTSVSREHIIIDVDIKRETGTYSYKASLYKPQLNETMFNGNKMLYGTMYDIKDQDVILLPDGTKLTFLNPVNK
ncbi:MAG: FHA domain-containing protein [Bacteroidaceae bacterium]|nr:FHA domain-containing protein [Bacteroidaceae bacterium]